MNAPSALAQPALACAACGVAGQAPAIVLIPNIAVLRFDWRGPKPRLLCDSCRNNPHGEAKSNPMWRSSKHDCDR
jgi:hypothetical protein